MNILIIGASGYIGLNFLKEVLSKDTNVKIKLIDYSEPEISNSFKDRVTFLKGDINQIINLANFFDHVDIVFHFLGKSLVRRSINLMSEDYHNDVCGTLKILSAMTASGIKKIVFISSGGTVYGNYSQLPIKETAQLNPICSYGLIKASIEKILQLYKRELLIDPIVLRLSSLYGPNYNKIGIQGVIPTFISNIKNNKDVTIFGTGEEIRDFFYIDDLLGLLMSIIYKNNFSDTFNIGSGVGVSINQIIQLLCGFSDKKVRINYIPKFKEDINNIVLDISKAEKMLNWEPVFDLNEGLKRCWNSY
jgi:UDP-glucose 4-epimerase